MQTDEQLFTAGEFAEIFDRYRQPLSTYVKTQTGCDSATAGEIVQQTFDHVREHKAGFTGKLRPWLYTIAFTLAHKHKTCVAQGCFS